MGFKEDADFARFVSMGAVGAAAVARHLRSEHGHQPIELERYAMANKVWHTKVKRLRLPDLVCIRCGRRIEARAKSKLGIILSHSDTPGREWDAGGMRENDLYAFVHTDTSSFPPRAGGPSYFTTQALRASLHRTKRSAPKAASEGSEVTLTWPSWVPGRTGTLELVDEDGRLICRWDDGNRLTYWQWRNWGEPRYLYVPEGSPVIAGETLVAGTVAPVGDLTCAGDTWDIAAGLQSPDASERYASIKAAGVLCRADLAPTLEGMVGDKVLDWRLRLEAMASLARLEPQQWTAPIADVADDPDCEAQQRMEAVFALSEIPTTDASDALAGIASPHDDRPPELRAAAAWGLGQGSAPRPDLLRGAIVDEDTIVALHAITAIESLPDTEVPLLIGWLGQPDNARGAVAAQLLLRHKRIDSLLDGYEGRNPVARNRALRALGDLPPEDLRSAAASRLTPDLCTALEPFWVGQQDWLRNSGREGLEALDIQKIRFDPFSY